MKFECKECIESCLLDMGDSSVIPEECPIGCEAVDWHKVTEPAALPKLTVEELERRWIEWPEWAEYAVVWPDETCAMYQNQPQLGDGGWLSTGGKWGGAKGLSEIRWDATDWQDSKIMRPEKVEQLPDWLKVGAWAAVGNFVGKVDWISRDASECRITCGESRFAKTGEVKPVTWRAWTLADIVPMFPVVVRWKSRKDNFASVICTAYDGGAWVGNRDQAIGFDDLLREYVKANGLPCGVPQVDGKDLEA